MEIANYSTLYTLVAAMSNRIGLQEEYDYQRQEIAYLPFRENYDETDLLAFSKLNEIIDKENVLRQEIEEYHKEIRAFITDAGCELLRTSGKTLLCNGITDSPSTYFHTHYKITVDRNNKLKIESIHNPQR